MKTHRSKDGTVLRLDQMEDSHLINTIKYFKRRAKEGITIRQGGGSCFEDIWYDTYKEYGEEAEIRLGLSYYIKEAKRRNLI